MGDLIGAGIASFMKVIKQPLRRGMDAPDALAKSVDTGMAGETSSVAPAAVAAASAAKMDADVRALLRESVPFNDVRYSVDRTPLQFQDLTSSGYPGAFHGTGKYSFQGVDLNGGTRTQAGGFHFNYDPQQKFNFSGIDLMGGRPPIISNVHMDQLGGA